MGNSYNDFRDKYRIVESNIATKRDIKNKPSRKRFNVRVAAGLAAGLVALGMVGCKNDKETPKTNQSAPITYSSTLTEERLEDAVEKAEQDFLKTYIEAYNKEFGTEYRTWETELVVNSIRDGVVYSVDGIEVTPGAYPALLKNALEEYGTVTTADCKDVFQILTVDGEILGTYNTNNLKAMHSGTQIVNSKNFDFYAERAEFKKLGINKEQVNAIIKLVDGKNQESKESIQMRVNEYNNTLQKNVDKQEDSER